MRRELEDALAAGSLGFTTSRGEGHLTSDDRPVASRVADWGEVNHLVMAMGKFGRRVFEFAPPSASRFGDLEVRRRFHEELLKLRSEEHTSELQSLMRISYAVFCLKKKKKYQQTKLIVY